MDIFCSDFLCLGGGDTIEFGVRFEPPLVAWVIFELKSSIKLPTYVESATFIEVVRSSRIDCMSVVIFFSISLASVTILASMSLLKSRLKDSNFADSFISRFFSNICMRFSTSCGVSCEL